ncbi:MAG: hypothetical protein HKP61_11515 [Dactylosporangium sp.]|nr:hypothetical protein [Dactylosporangium sp.]NNJ61554.1 hypothetical protein [Dactylosporangium sp.]
MPQTRGSATPPRAFLSKALDVCVPFNTLYRHLPILRPCLGPRDSALLLAPCARSGRPGRRTGLRNLLLLTRFRLVITSESRLLRRLRLHLNADLNQLAEVAWTPEPEQGAVQLAATAIDGVREHLWIKVGAIDRVWRLDSLLRDAFAARPIMATGPFLPHAGYHPAIA